MTATRYASVLGLGFGDCGKGHFVDALTRRWQAHTIVRFNGGAQAGHNVVTRAEGNAPARHHTFSQFGAGSLAPGVCTVLADPMVLHPTALLVEADVLGRIGVHDALARLIIDAQCRVTTPYHQAAGRLRERLRGASAHGSCGVGVGETVRHSQQNPSGVLRYGDFAHSNAALATVLGDKLQRIRETLLEELLPLFEAGGADEGLEELQVLQDETLAIRWLNHCRALARQCRPQFVAAIHDKLKQPGCVLFEGAQGVLLDEWHGFHPHTTWSSVGSAAAETVAARLGIKEPIEHYGALRSYLTRHGIGPLPTHDESLDDLLPEPHNSGDGWQGRFRRGHPDAVLLRYALEVGRLSGLLIGHLDIFERGVILKWCERYSGASHDCIERLPVSSGPDLSHQSTLTNVLLGARPQYAAESIDSAAEFLDRLASVTDIPVLMRSYGPTHLEVYER